MYCSKLAGPLIRRIETENKTLDEIAGEVCGDTVKDPRHKIIRMIKLMLGNEYLVAHSASLGYHPEKANRQPTKTDEVVKGNFLTEKEVEDSDTSGQDNSVTPVTSCQTTLQAVNTEQVKDAGQTKRQEQVIEPDAPAACCQERVVRKKIVSENRDSAEETTGQEYEDALELNMSNVLVEALKKLIRLFSLEDVKNALVVAESDI